MGTENNGVYDEIVINEPNMNFEQVLNILLMTYQKNFREKNIY